MRSPGVAAVVEAEEVRVSFLENAADIPLRGRNESFKDMSLMTVTDQQVSRTIRVNVSLMPETDKALWKRVLYVASKGTPRKKTSANILLLLMWRLHPESCPGLAEKSRSPQNYANES